MENRAGKKLNYSTDIEEHLSYLMQRYGKQVYRLAYYYVRDKHLAEDIYQEVFIRVYKNYHKFRHESSFYTWIYRITVNLCKDYLKSAKVRRIITAGFLKDNSTPRNSISSWRKLRVVEFSVQLWSFLKDTDFQ